MNNYKHKNNNGVIALLFACILVLAVFVAAACTNGFTTVNPYGWFDKPQSEEETKNINGVLEIEEVTTSSFVRILSGAEATIASDENDSVVSRSLVATVKPDEAPNKKVDWQLYWASDAPLKDSDISEYLTIAPESDGSTNATLTCKKSFKGSTACVRVTTRVGGFYAVCNVYFYGMPSALEIDATGYEHVRLPDYSYPNVSDNYFPIGVVANQANVLPINLDNAFHDVGSDFYNQLEIDLIVGYGTINIQEQSIFDARYSYTDKGSVSINDIKDDLIQVTIENGNLIITPKSTLQGYRKLTYKDASNTAYKYDIFKSMGTYPTVSGSFPIPHYFSIRVSYGSNTSHYCYAVINVTIVTQASSVSLDPTAIVF